MQTSKTFLSITSQTVWKATKHHPNLYSKPVIPRCETILEFWFSIESSKLNDNCRKLYSGLTIAAISCVTFHSQHAQWLCFFDTFDTSTCASSYVLTCSASLQVQNIHSCHVCPTTTHKVRICLLAWGSFKKLISTQWKQSSYFDEIYLKRRTYLGIWAHKKMKMIKSFRCYHFCTWTRHQLRSATWLKNNLSDLVLHKKIIFSLI